MDREHLKRLLAGVSIAGLMTGAVLGTPKYAASA